MTQLTCEHISGQHFRQLFDLELTDDSLENFIIRAGQLSVGDLHRRQDADCTYIDWRQNGIYYTAGLRDSVLLFLNLNFESNQVSAAQVISCLGSPEWYQAWSDTYPYLDTSTTQVALFFPSHRCIAYGTRHDSHALSEPPILDDTLPVSHLSIFGPDWLSDTRALKMARSWPGHWQGLSIKLTEHREARPSTWVPPARPFNAIPIEGALAQIAAAFADAPRPPDEQLLHADSCDDSDILRLYGLSRWQDLPDAVAEAEYSALAFLSPAGFRHFLPAYMSWVLRHRDSGAAVIGATIFALTPVLEGSLRGYMLSKYSLLDAKQRAAVVCFLETMVGFEDVEPSLAYWHGRD
jgi:hypothetical protein